MRNSKQENEQNFWISYADLMAGLLFVFILLIGAIVIKYVFIQNNLNEQSKSLEKNKNKVAAISSELLSTKESLKLIRALLKDEESKNKDLNNSLLKARGEISSLNDMLVQGKSELEKERNLAKTLDENLSKNTEELRLSQEQIQALRDKLLQSTLSHQKLVEDLNLTKARIKNLTGIRIKAIKALKNKLKHIEVDPNNGAIRLPSSVLFDVDSYEIKPKAKEGLKKTLIKYIDTLLKDKSLRGYIDSIVIEGYTDTDGTYMYNLELSQKRALAVLDFLYSQKGVDKKLLRRYVSASGRSYSNVIKKDGKEDKEASRRIEVKFSISNKKAIQEIEDFLKK